MNPTICKTCDHMEGCRVKAPGSEKPTVLCEEFSQEPVANPVNGGDLLEAVDAVTPVSGAQGLCQNCCHRETCQWTKQPGGVWHCEEFS